MTRTLLVLAFAATAWPAPALAQIYAWRDASGQLILSDRKVDGTAVTTTYAVPESSAFRATRAPAANDVRAKFEGLVQEHAALQGIRPDLVRAVIQVESGFNPSARSPKGAMGLMQLMPRTARELGVVNAYDPAQNIRGGTAYLRHLLDRFGGNEELALAAYNAGPDAVDRYDGVPPYDETQAYVRKVGSVAEVEAPAPARPAAAKWIIYKVVEVVDGRPVVRYSTERPASGSYEVVQR